MSDLSPQHLDSIMQLMSAINCGASLIDRSGKIVHVNSRMCEMTQLPSQVLVGASVAGFYEDLEDRQRVREALENFDQTSEAEFYLPLPDGGRLPIISSARPLSDRPPMSDYRLVTMIDISKQKNAEAKAKEQYDLVVQMSDTLLQQAVELKRYSQTLEQRVAQRTIELRQAHRDTICMLAVASEAKDQDTGHHVRRIAHYSRQLAQKIGFNESDAETIGYSSILHDVGKIHVPDDILTKPGALDADERARMQQHTLAGERILSGSPFFAQARQIARSHHENWDGSGYPDGLAGDSIPIETRIVHLADVYDALTHQRVYKQAWPHERALGAIHESRGTMFDPQVVDAFDALCAENPAALTIPSGHG